MNKMLHVTITLLGILFFITSGSFAKNTSVLFDGDSIAGIIKSDSLLNWNKEYLIAVHNKSTQKESKFLSGIISEWDITKAPDFGTKEDDYTAVFITTKGQAEVIYNYEGRIINVKKHLKNIMLPVHVYKTVAKKFKGWDIVQNKYKLSFKSGAEVLKTYVVTLEKGSRKKIFHLKI